jgi:hypothetical protein
MTEGKIIRLKRKERSKGRRLEKKKRQLKAKNATENVKNKHIT